MNLSLIVAMSENRVIGRDGDLPWRLSADLKRFKSLTMGHHLVMGRATFDSIGRLLPGRETVVLTRDRGFAFTGATIIHDLASLGAAVESDSEAFVVGGAEIYRQTLPIVDRLYVTRVHANINGDTFFPEWNLSRWHMTDAESHSADDHNEFDYTFETYERVRQNADS